MVEWLRQQGCQVIEIDTDGIYFVPSSQITTPQAEGVLVAELKASLPEGIDVELDGRYQAMLSYKMKNYALLGYNGKLVLKGSGLRSRGLERFQREFLREFIGLLLKGEAAKIRPLYETYLKRMERHEWDVAQFSKTEALTDSLATYQQKVVQKKRNPSALYELALKSGRDYQPGDQLSYYVTGTRKTVKVYESCKLASQWDPAQPDENVAYYQEKLKELFAKFEGYLPAVEPAQGRLDWGM
jgi:DNA polymerase, archaea type